MAAYYLKDNTTGALSYTGYPGNIIMSQRIDLVDIMAGNVALVSSTGSALTPTVGGIDSTETILLPLPAGTILTLVGIYVHDTVAGTFTIDLGDNSDMDGYGVALDVTAAGFGIDDDPALLTAGGEQAKALDAAGVISVEFNNDNNLLPDFTVWAMGSYLPI